MREHERKPVRVREPGPAPPLESAPPPERAPTRARAGPQAQSQTLYGSVSSITVIEYGGSFVSSFPPETFASPATKP